MGTCLEELSGERGEDPGALVVVVARVDASEQAALLRGLADDVLGGLLEGPGVVRGVLGHSVAAHHEG